MRPNKTSTQQKKQGENKVRIANPEKSAGSGYSNNWRHFHSLIGDD
jgi:hypothetical protein